MGVGALGAAVATAVGKGGSSRIYAVYGTSP